MWQYTLVLGWTLLALVGYGQSLKPLEIKDFDRWRDVSGATLTRSGAYTAYTLQPQEGDGVLVLHGPDNRVIDTLPRATGGVFDYAGGFLVARIVPHSDSLRAQKRRKLKPDQQTKDSLAIYDLAGRRVTKVGRVKAFALPEKAGGWVAYRHEPALPPPPAPNDTTADSTAQSKPPAPPAKKETDKTGTELVVRQMATGVELRFPFVLQFAFDQGGQYLAFATTGNDSTFKAGVYLVDLRSRQHRPLYRRSGAYSHLVFDETGTQLAFLADFVNTDPPPPIVYHQLLYCRLGAADTARVLADTSAAFLPEGWLVQGATKPVFARDGKRLFFGTQPPPVVQDTTLLPEEIVNVEVWAYTDSRIYPQQNKQLADDKAFGHLAVYDVAAGSLRQLATPDWRTVHLPDEGTRPYVVLERDEPYLRAVSWEGRAASDYARLDLASGAITPLLTAQHSPVILSPGGKFLLGWDYALRQWFTLEVTTGTRRVVTQAIGVPLWDVEDDHPDEPYPYGTAGWTQDDARVLIYDQYDLWLVDPLAQAAPRRLTDGRAQRLHHRALQLDPDARFYGANETLLLQLSSDSTRQEGFAELTLSPARTLPVRTLLLADAAYAPQAVRKALEGNRYLFTRQTFTDYPDLYTTTDGFATHTRLSAANPWQATYRWGTVRRVYWKSATGVPLEGLLYLPQGLDTAQRYPLIAYFYERLSDTYHNYVTPAPQPSRLNIALYVSNGYCVFVPDIVYTDGYPGQSAEDCIVPGVLQVLAEHAYIDRGRMALQGQSWGGYQIAHLITRTTLFACAYAGAPVANMTSAYGGIRWGSGLSRAFQYERSQSRIGGPPWQLPLQYIENSPLFWLERVTTPLLIMHNDADGAVPWYQGIELYSALRRLNRPVWLLNYIGEDHNLVQRKNRKDLTLRQLQFFDHYLKGAPQPRWMQRGVPATEKSIRQGFELAPEGR